MNAGLVRLRTIMICAALTSVFAMSHADAVVQPLAYIPASNREPAKVELRMDAHLVVRITCDGPRRLSFDFPKERGYRSLPLSERQKPLEFEFEGGGTYFLATRDTSARRMGLLQLGPGFLKELDHSQLAWFWGPSEMGEPWSVTNLQALRRLTGECSSAGVPTSAMGGR